MKRIVLLISMLVMASLVFAQESQQGIRFLEGQPWEKVLKMAGKQHKYIFMDCYTSWCGPCRALAKDVFTQKKVGDFFNSHFINVKYDMEKGIGKELHDRYQSEIIGFPTLLLLDSEGRVVHRMAGFQEPEALIAGMEDGLAGRTLYAYREKYESGSRDFPFLKAYVESLNGAFMRKEAEAVILEYMQSLSMDSLLEKGNWEFVYKFIKDPLSPQFEYLVNHLDKVCRTTGCDRYDLENRLGRYIYMAVRDVVELKSDNHGELKPLQDRREKLGRLMALMDKGGFRQAGECRAKVFLYGLVLEGRWEKMFNCLSVCREVGILNYAEVYVDEMVRYMAGRTDDQALLQKGLALMLEMQGEEDASQSKWKVNHYKTLSVLYDRLGDTANADKYLKMHRKIEEENQKKFESYLKNR